MSLSYEQEPKKRSNIPVYAAMATIVVLVGVVLLGFGFMANSLYEAHVAAQSVKDSSLDPAARGNAGNGAGRNGDPVESRRADNNPPSVDESSRVNPDPPSGCKQNCTPPGKSSDDSSRDTPDRERPGSAKKQSSLPRENMPPEPHDCMPAPGQDSC